ncbi:BTAD domain-containing putative transcriptional regulator [Hamadaea tsunoensis]|uniref:BTAD domain-containing putative transcriptional regulator n=1 Tax=Hamadaea tsunoensis TaxID=53368 RepID=UPI00040324C1|nr:BTAD domain-containing putative transcriptional regulator [Hamadaea tsunoensis]
MSTLDIRVLGALSLRVDGVEMPLGGPRQRAVLACLLVARPRSVSVGRIVEDVWDGEVAPSPTTLHAYIAELRRVVEPGRRARGAAQVLTTEGAGYALRVPPSSVDASEFVRLAGAGANLLRDGDAQGALAALEDALALWRGPAFADLGEYAFLAAEIRRLDQLREAVRLDRFEALLGLGRPDHVLGELAAYVHDHPLSERGRELYALALYRSGRQTEALDSVREAVELLADSFGLDAGPSLRALETAILRQDSDLDVREGTPKGTGDLPHPLASFVGREGELADLARALENHRLVTVTGAAGLGKTRLAVEAAHRMESYADGPWFVELADIGRPDLVAAQVAAAVGVPVDGWELLARRETLIVLDNCEHLVDAVRGLCAKLLARCPGLKILATSRESLGLAGEFVLDVPPMAADGVRLFLDRAAPWMIEDDRELVERICAGVDGVPLAIELAAAQCRVLSLAQIAAALPAGPGADPAKPARHRDLDRAIAWSHDLLDPAERELFGRLSVFAGRFDYDAAGAVTGTPDLIGPLAALVRKSLLRVEPGTSPRRYRMLVALRTFAAATLDPPAAAALAARHRHWVVDWVEAAEGGLRTFDAYAVIRRLEADQPEIRAALESALLDGDGTAALRIGGALHWFWYRRGQITEGLNWLRAALDLAPAAPAVLRARAQLGVAGLAYLGGDLASALAAARSARAAGDRLTTAYAQAYEAHFLSLSGRVAEALPIALAAERGGRRLRVPWLHTETLMVLGMVRRLAGDRTRARIDLARAVEIGERCGHRWATGSAAWTAMKSALDADDPAAALDLAARILGPLESELDITSWLVLAHTTAAAFALAGDPTPAALLMGAVEKLGAEVGFRPSMMDLVDGPREAEAVRDALPPQELERLRAEGSKLTRAEVSALITGRTLTASAA